MNTMQPPTPPRRGRPPLALTPEQRQERQRSQGAARSAKLRKARRAAGNVTLRVVLSAEQAAAFTTMMEAQRGALASFPARALLTGARFLANSGAPAGRKPGKTKPL